MTSNKQISEAIKELTEILNRRKISATVAISKLNKKVLVVYLESDEIRHKIPLSINGVTVICKVIGKVLPA